MIPCGKAEFLRNGRLDDSLREGWVDGTDGRLRAEIPGMIGMKSMEKGNRESCSRNPYNHFFTHGVKGLVDLDQFCLVARVKEPTTDSL